MLGPERPTNPRRSRGTAKLYACGWLRLPPLGVESYSRPTLYLASTCTNALADFLPFRPVPAGGTYECMNPLWRASVSRRCGPSSSLDRYMKKGTREVVPSRRRDLRKHPRAERSGSGSNPGRADAHAGVGDAMLRRGFAPPPLMIPPTPELPALRVPSLLCDVRCASSESPRGSGARRRSVPAQRQDAPVPGLSPIPRHHQRHKSQRDAFVRQPKNESWM